MRKVLFGLLAFFERAKRFITEVFRIEAKIFRQERRCHPDECALRASSTNKKPRKRQCAPGLNFQQVLTMRRILPTACRAC